MDGKTLARIAAAFLVAVAVAATALEMRRKEDRPVGEGQQAPAAWVPDPLRDGLRRCQTLGETALSDDGCARLWAKQRERFLGHPEKPSASSIGEPAVSQATDFGLHKAR